MANVAIIARILGKVKWHVRASKSNCRHILVVKALSKVCSSPECAMKRGMENIDGNSAIWRWAIPQEVATGRLFLQGLSPLWGF